MIRQRSWLTPSGPSPWDGDVVSATCGDLGSNQWVLIKPPHP